VSSDALAAIAFAIVFHVAAIYSLSTADPPAPESWDDETTVELEPDPPPKPKVEVPKPPEPKPEPIQEPVKVIAKIDPKPTPRAEPKQTAPIQADEPDEETAGGDPDLPAPGGTLKMGDIVPGGTAMGGVGDSDNSGKGGSGKGTEKGGDGGDGKGNKKPTSIASIKKRAMPINNRDVIGDRRFNDIVGDVVVKLIVDQRGVVTKATLIKRLKPKVDSIALAWARKLRFTPAIDQNDKPVTSVVNFTFTFRPPT